MSNNTSNFNMTNVNTKQLEENLKATIDFGGNAFVFGLKGSGKTVISKQAIEDMDMQLVYLNCSTMERPDFSGYPDFAASRKDGYIDYLLPSYYKAMMQDVGDKGPQVVALLDETDKASHDLHAPLLEFTQFHSMNGRRLPNLRSVIMTGNLISEGSNRPSIPLLDRAEKFLVEPSITQWLDWAGSKRGNIHPSITAFLNDHAECLFSDNGNDENYASESPRGWEYASKVINYGEAHKWPNAMISQKIAACIGRASGLKFDQYYTHYVILRPLIEKIMNNVNVQKEFDALEPSKRCVAAFVVCSKLARAIDDMEAKKKKGLPPEVEPVGNWINKIDPEIALIAFRANVGLKRTLDSGLDDSPLFDQLLKNISKRVNGS